MSWGYKERIVNNDELSKMLAIFFGFVAAFLWAFTVLVFINGVHFGAILFALISGTSTVACFQFAYDYFKGFEIEYRRE